MLDDRLKLLGLKEEETNTYLTLLDLGSCSASELSKRMSQPRATIYGYLDRLVSLGLAYQCLQNKTKFYVAERPTKITQLFEKRISELKKEKDAVKKIIPKLEKKVAHHFSRPKLQVFEGRNDICNAMEDVLNYKDITNYKFWAIKSAVNTLSEDYFDWHNRERIKRRNWSDTIWQKSQLLNENKHPYLGVGDPFYRHARLCPASIDFKMGYWVYEDKVLMLSSLQESFAFIVESAEYAEIMIAQHQYVWKHSEKIPDSEPKIVKRFFQEA